MKPEHNRFFASALMAFVLLMTLCLHGDTLYVSSVNGNKLYRISSTGAVTPFATISFLPEGLAFDTNGLLYVANDGGNWINRVTTSGGVSVFATNVTQPYGLAFDSKGNLYAACQSSPVGQIKEITPQRVASTFWPLVYAPYGLAIDASDNVYVSSDYYSIYKITPAGSFSRCGTVSGATGLAFDKAGVLYVASISGAITSITPAGVASTFATGLGKLIGLAFDNAGNLYAADYLVGTVWKVAPDRSVTTFATVPGNPSFIAVFPPPRFDPALLNIAPCGDDIVVSWFGNFVLQSATNAAGPYSDVVGPASPYTNSISSAQAAFFRLRN